MLALRFGYAPRGLNVRPAAQNYATKAEAKPSATPTLSRPAKVHAVRLKRRKQVTGKNWRQMVLSERMGQYFKLKHSPTKIVRSKTMQKIASVLPSYPSTFDFDEFSMTNQEFKNLGIAAETTTVAKYWDIFPTVMPKFTPSINLKVKHSDSVMVYRGIALGALQVREKPLVKFEGKEGAFYTVMMIDPDIPLKDTDQAMWNHYTVANVAGNDLEKGQVLADWIPPAPPRDTGVHRYIWLLLEQPKGHIDFSEKPKTSSDFDRVFNFANFVSKYQLKPRGICFHRTEFDKDVAELYSSWRAHYSGFDVRDYRKKQLIKQRQYQNM